MPYKNTIAHTSLLSNPFFLSKFSNVCTADSIYKYILKRKISLYGVGLHVI